MTDFIFVAFKPVNHKSTLFNGECVEIIGVFSDPKKADKACVGDRDFYCPIEIDRVFPRETYSDVPALCPRQSMVYDGKKWKSGQTLSYDGKEWAISPPLDDARYENTRGIFKPKPENEIKPALDWEKDNPG